MTLPKVFSNRSLYKHGAKFFISQCSRRIGWPDARLETGAGFLAPSTIKSLSYLVFRSLLISHPAMGPLRHERAVACALMDKHCVFLRRAAARQWSIISNSRPDGRSRTHPDAPSLLRRRRDVPEKPGLSVGNDTIAITVAPSSGKGSTDA